jgi:hypothetical protein
MAKPDYETAIWLTRGGHKALYCDHFDGEIPTAFGKNRLLGHIWAACQCELLTYRRIGEEDPWVSNRIDVGTIARSLELGSAQEIPYVKEGRLKEYCGCGWFHGYEGRCRRERACSEYFSNLDDWNRTTFLDDALIDECNGTTFLDDTLTADLLY